MHCVKYSKLKMDWKWVSGGEFRDVTEVLVGIHGLSLQYGGNLLKDVCCTSFIVLLQDLRD